MDDLLDKQSTCTTHAYTFTNFFPTQVQAYLYSHIATELGTKPLGRSGLLLQDLVTVPHLLFTLREHYSVVGGAGGRAQIRPYIILIIKEFVLTVSTPSAVVVNAQENLTL